MHETSQRPSRTSQPVIQIGSSAGIITTVNGTATFDAGSINIMYEG